MRCADVCPMVRSMKRDTRTRILVASLLLFNEQGEPGTTTSEIADAVEISPGNLHYHFHRKANIVTALLAEFQADARRVLAPPDDLPASLDDFWVFLHLLLELKAAYGFLFRDTEMLVVDYPKVANAMHHFARGLTASFELQLRSLKDSGVIELGVADTLQLSRNLAVLSLYSERFDALIQPNLSADESSLRTAAAVFGLLKPLTSSDALRHLDELLTHYEASGI